MYPMKKKVLLFFVFIFCVYVSNAQSTLADDSGDEQNFDVQKELERQIQIPNTPEAQAFEKYGNTSVSLYTGTPNISIPIYTIPGRELSLPISLTYDASGVKVSQMASQAGLSWNLNVGGRISRTVNGLIDDYISSTPGYLSLGNPNKNSETVLLFNGGGSTGESLRDLVEGYKNPPSSFESLAKGKQYINFLKDLSENRFDTQPDYFSFSALGYSDTFVLDVVTNTFIALKNPRTKVTASYIGSSLNEWVVTIDNGTKFYFGQAEITEKQSDDNSGSSIPIQFYNSSWVLTKVISSLSKDTFKFTYDTNEKTDNESYLISSITTTFPENVLNPVPDHHISTVGGAYFYKSKILKQISHNEKKIIRISFKERLDQKLISGNNYSAIDQISIYRASNRILKKFKLHHSYFGITNYANPESFRNSPWNLRLKLDSISILSDSNISEKSYKFEYISASDVPSRISLQQDYLGYSNGGNGGSVLYPQVAFNGVVLSGANRNPNFNQAKKGILEKITYPTGGYSVFEYEGNKVTEYASTTEDVTYGVISVAGATNTNDDSCGNCCEEQYDATQPNIVSKTFTIPEDRLYDLDYRESGSIGEAYIVKLSEELKENMPPIGYNEIIDQGNCNFLYETEWSNYSAISSEIYLTRGTYQVTVAKLYGTTYIKVNGDQTTTGYSNTPKAGIRIKTIKDYRDTNILASEKEYKYVTAIVAGTSDTDQYGWYTTINNVNESSGKVLFNPSMYSFQYYNVYEPPNIVEKRSIVRKTSWSGGDRPHVGYKRVFEIQRKQKAPGSSLYLYNGYQIHDFNTGMYNGVSTDQGVSYYRSDFETGKEKRKAAFNTINQLQTEEKNKYIDTKYFGNTALYPFENYQNGLYYILFEQHSQNTWRYTYIAPTWQGFKPNLGGGPGPLKPQQPDICTESSNFCFNTDFSSLGSRITYAQGKTGGLLNKENSQFYAGNIIKTTTDYSYYDTGSNPNYLLKQAQVTTSEEDVLKKVFTYPISGPLYNANIIANPIETKTFKNNNLLSRQKTIYSGIYPSKIQTSKGTSNLEDRLLFERYKYGNLVQVKQVNGTSTAYLWGYEGKHVVAKVENATYAQIEQLSVFGSNTNLTSNLSDAQETALRNISNAMVTTFKYIPQIGVTSITDPRGRTVFYEYDEFNRLEFVKDQEGKILNENQYNYKN